MRQLSGPHYEVVDRDLTGEITAMVYRAVRNLYVDNVINKEIFEFLNPHNHQIKTPSLYLLPKIHKNPPGGTRFVGRPIISGCGAPTQQISKYMDFFLLPIVKQQSTYTRDSSQVLKRLNNLTMGQDNLLIALDIVSMYTNCPQKEAIDSVCDALEQAKSGLYTIPKPTRKHTQCLLVLELILGANVFEFNNKFYRQKIGVAMGSVCSPEICDITLLKYEKEKQGVGFY